MTTFRLVGVHKTYPGTQPVHALRGVDLVISSGEFVVIEGASASGKSTLLNVLALLDAPTAGQYLIDDRDVAALDERERARVRGQVFGFVFQGFHLMDRRTVVDNVELGMLYAGVPADVRRHRALAALERVGLPGTAHRRANELSGGQRQRVAIARALCVGSGVIVADEPTGNLDSATSRTILELLHELHAAGTTVVLVTHSAEIANGAPRRLLVRDGRIAVGPPAVPRTAFDGEDFASAPVAPTATRPARVSSLTIARDAAASVLSRRGRAGSLAAGVAVGVALALTTIGVSASAQAQVSERFDAQLNRAVALSREVPNPESGALVVVDGTTPGVSRESVATLEALPGVDFGALLTRNDSVSVALPGAGSPPADAFLMGATEDIVPAAQLDVRWAGDAPTALAEDEILIGGVLNAQLDLGPLSARPQVLLDGRPFAVRGIVSSGIRVTNVTQAVITTVDVAATMRTASVDEIYLRTAAGAAGQVARQAPLVLRPQSPESFTVSVPPDPATLRGQIEGDVRTILLVLTAVAVLASVVSLTSAMTMSVLERSQEFGMRRAIGAQARHIGALVMCEASLVGAIGGAAGAVTGVLALLLITIARRWTPVLDLVHIPLAVAGGVAVGVLGGVAASVRSRRIQPSEALRS
ncbi:ABC transporter ATP-binding protein/permease [Cellulomonas triticagri]|uniref:ATP-binding cassette domain-containing protein n=1 Tax=Cellulomonas triticagri TaxID=2483352 RepID=A0A3M2J6J5_9CELL|nr:ABC transporter ATP-binding protein/permease [Cellulomonas triticagri]RMI09737.1 ATP-binding cassette domain-containing protein [Cellulomonas triticagri]